MGEQDQRAMYSLRDAVEGLSRNINGQWEQGQMIQMHLSQLTEQLTRLNDSLESQPVIRKALTDMAHRMTEMRLERPDGHKDYSGLLAAEIEICNRIKKLYTE
jgi:uncharacterized coiled-coil protein SlyX